MTNKLTISYAKTGTEATYAWIVRLLASAKRQHEY
jgi:hypothetical protein